jgi:hypothetical protein
LALRQHRPGVSIGRCGRLLLLSVLAAAGLEGKKQKMTAPGHKRADASDMFWVHTASRREFGVTAEVIRAVPANDRQRAEI